MQLYKWRQDQAKKKKKKEKKEGATKNVKVHSHAKPLL
jgi:hypothetical protein